MEATQQDPPIIPLTASQLRSQLAELKISNITIASAMEVTPEWISTILGEKRDSEALRLKMTVYLINFRKKAESHE